MKWIELTDTHGDSVLFNLDHISAIYSICDHARIITIDCGDDGYYDVQESVATIAKLIKNLAPLLEREKELSPAQPNIPITPYVTETHTIDESMWTF